MHSLNKKLWPRISSISKLMHLLSNSVNSTCYFYSTISSFFRPSLLIVYYFNFDFDKAFYAPVFCKTVASKTRVDALLTFSVSIHKFETLDQKHWSWYAPFFLSVMCHCTSCCLTGNIFNCFQHNSIKFMENGEEKSEIKSSGMLWVAKCPTEIRPTDESVSGK